MNIHLRTIINENKSVLLVFTAIIILILIKFVWLFIDFDKLKNPYQKLFSNWYEQVFYFSVFTPFAEELIVRAGASFLPMFFIFIPYFFYEKYKKDALDKKLSFSIEMTKFTKGIKLYELNNFKLYHIFPLISMLVLNYYWASLHENYGDSKVIITFIGGFIYIIAYYYKGFVLAYLFHLSNNLIGQIDVIISPNIMIQTLFDIIMIILLDSLFILILYYMDRKKVFNKGFLVIPILVSFLSLINVFFVYILKLSLPDLIIQDLMINSFLVFIIVVLYGKEIRTSIENIF